MADWGGAGSGALSGAAAGATLGSIVPGIGNAVGAIGGGIIGAAGGLFGNKKKKKRLSAFDKKQQRLNDQQHQSILGEGPLADLYNYDPEAANSVFDKNVANPAFRNLREQGIPQITGQYRKNGLMDSSYSADAIGKLTRDVQEGLDAKRSQFLYGEQSDARNAKRNAVENLQNRQTFAYDKNKGGGFNIDQVINSLTPENLESLTKLFSKT